MTDAHDTISRKAALEAISEADPHNPVKDAIAALPSVGVTVKPGQVERIVWDAMVWAAFARPGKPGDLIPDYTDLGNSEAETECRAAAARILAAIDVQPAPIPLANWRDPNQWAAAAEHLTSQPVLSPDVALPVDELATLMLDTWKRVDPKSKVAMYPTSYVANFADMARAVLAALAQKGGDA